MAVLWAELDSLKARLTRRGNVLLHEFCAEHDVPVRRCGKLVVARDPGELPAFDELRNRLARWLVGYRANRGRHSRILPTRRRERSGSC